MNNNSNNNNVFFYDDSDDTTSMSTSLIKTNSIAEIYHISELNFSEDSEFLEDILEFISNDNINDNDKLTPEKITMISAISLNYKGVFNYSFKQKIHNNKQFINKKRSINFTCYKYLGNLNNIHKQNNITKKKSNIDNSNGLKKYNDYHKKDFKENKINISSNNSIKNELYQDDFNFFNKIYSNFRFSILSLIIYVSPLI